MFVFIDIWPLTASITIEVKNNHAHVTTQRISHKFIETNFSVRCMVWPWCCLFQYWLPFENIDEITISYCSSLQLTFPTRYFLDHQSIYQPWIGSKRLWHPTIFHQKYLQVCWLQSHFELVQRFKMQSV